jgi:hypothetical protein
MANAVLQCGHMMANGDYGQYYENLYKGVRRRGMIYLGHRVIKKDYERGWKERSEMTPQTKVWRGYGG